jgi:hypothetical protein
MIEKAKSVVEKECETLRKENSDLSSQVSYSCVLSLFLYELLYTIDDIHERTFSISNSRIKRSL